MSLPAELIHRIIEEVRDDPQTLAACGSAAKVFTALAQQFLYTSITIGGPSLAGASHDVARFQTLLEIDKASPHLLQHTRRLKIYVVRWLVPGLTNICDNPELLRILAILDKLQEVHMIGHPLPDATNVKQHIGASLRRGLLRIFSLTTLISVRIERLDGFSTSFLADSLSIQELYLDDCELAPIPESTEMTLAGDLCPAPIKALKIGWNPKRGSNPANVLTWIASAPSQFKLNAIRRLAVMSVTPGAVQLPGAVSSLLRSRPKLRGLSLRSFQAVALDLTLNLQPFPHLTDLDFEFIASRDVHIQHDEVQAFMRLLARVNPKNRVETITCGWDMSNHERALSPPPIEQAIANHRYTTWRDLDEFFAESTAFPLLTTLRMRITGVELDSGTARVSVGLTKEERVKRLLALLRSYFPRLEDRGILDVKIHIGRSSHLTMD